MTWGILLYKSPGIYTSLTLAHDSLYDAMRDNAHKYDMKFLGGKKGISDEEIDSICDRVENLASRLNEGENLDIESELELAFSN